MLIYAVRVCSQTNRAQAIPASATFAQSAAPAVATWHRKLPSIFEAVAGWANPQHGRNTRKLDREQGPLDSAMTFGRKEFAVFHQAV